MFPLITFNSPGINDQEQLGKHLYITGLLRLIAITAMEVNSPQFKSRLGTF